MSAGEAGAGGADHRVLDGGQRLGASSRREFVRPCNLCPHMKRITLANIRAALEEMRHEVTIDPAFAGRARLAVERMLAVK